MQFSAKIDKIIGWRPPPPPRELAPPPRGNPGSATVCDATDGWEFSDNHFHLCQIHKTITNSQIWSTITQVYWPRVFDKNYVIKWNLFFLTFVDDWNKNSNNMFQMFFLFPGMRYNTESISVICGWSIFSDQLHYSIDVHYKKQQP